MSVRMGPKLAKIQRDAISEPWCTSGVFQLRQYSNLTSASEKGTNIFLEILVNFRPIRAGPGWPRTPPGPPSSLGPFINCRQKNADIRKVN